MSKKIKLTALLLAVLMIAALPASVLANENNGAETLILQFEILRLETDYTTDEAYASYSYDGLTTTAEIRDIETNEVLEIHSEEREQVVNSRSDDGDYTTLEFKSTITPSDNYPVDVNVVTNVRVYQEKVNGRVLFTLLEVLGSDQYLDDDCSEEIESELTSATISANRKKLSVSASGVLRTTVTICNSWGIDPSDMSSFGFSVSENFYFRKSYSKSYSMTVQ